MIPTEREVEDFSRAGHEKEFRSAGGMGKIQSLSSIIWGLRGALLNKSAINIPPKIIVDLRRTIFPPYI